MWFQSEIIWSVIMQWQNWVVRCKTFLNFRMCRLNYTKLHYLTQMLLRYWDVAAICLSKHWAEHWAETGMGNYVGRFCRRVLRVLSMFGLCVGLTSLILSNLVSHFANCQLGMRARSYFRYLYMCPWYVRSSTSSPFGVKKTQSV